MFNSKDLVKYWNRAAEVYNHDFSLETKYNANIQALFSQHFPCDTQKIFDCGTGNGEIALTLAQKGYELIAGDISSNMIDEAKHNSEKYSLNLDFLILDATALPFKDKCFDAVVSNIMLYTTLDPKPVVNEWHRVLKPKGKLVYIDGNLCALPRIIMKIPILLIKVIEKIADDSEPSYAYLLESVWSKDVKRPHYDKKLLDEIGFNNIITINHIDLKVHRLRRFFTRGWIYPIFFVSAEK